MAWYGNNGFDDWGGFAPYVPVAVRRANGLRMARELQRKGEKLEPVQIEGRAIATTFWGKAWCEHIELHSDFANRLPRGRTYARNRSIVDLKIQPGTVRALVSGSELYSVKLDVEPLAPKKWRAMVRECAGKIDSVVELLSGQLSDAVMEVLCDAKRGVFPAPEQLSMSCSCPDYASLCKHLAAVLYGIGSRLDRKPELLFVLRGVDQMDMVDAASGGAVLGGKRASADELKASELSEVFGIELDAGPARATAPKTPRKARRGRRKPRARRVGP